MTSVRVWYWLGGLVLVVLVSLAIELAPGGRDEGAWLVVAFWLLAGLAGEIVAHFRAQRRLPADEPPRDTRAADGDVEIATMIGVSGARNPDDSRFQRFVGWVLDRPVAPTGRVGERRCPPLLGRVVWISLFVGKDGRPWSDSEIAQAHHSMFKAGAWIEREAIRWGAAVNIELADTYFVAGDDRGDDEVEVALVPTGDRFAPADAREPTKLWTGVSRAVAALGCADAVDWLARVHPRVEADVRVWLVHVRRSGCSQVIAEHDTDVGSIRFAVCYARESLFPEPLRRPPFVDPATVAHEMLHLFDATDKYEVPLDSFPARTVTSRDVMRLSRSRLSQLRVDAKTAAEIGWA